MKKSNLLILALIVFMFVGCSKDDDGGSEPVVVPPPPTAVLTVTLNGLEPLGDAYEYEGWIMVNGNPVSTGKFDTAGASTTKEFTVLESDLEVATAFVLSIELETDDPVGPSDTKILSGTFTAGSALLNINEFVGDFIDQTNVFSGSFINSTPTDNIGGMDNDNNQFGIWFVESDFVTAGLKNLPVLKPGWKYEGWVIFDGTPVTTGQFLMADGSDFLSPYSGNEDDYPFPGEDFIGNLPDGVTGDTTGKMVVISIEPDFITDPNEPFFLKPISGMQGPNTLMVTSNINANITGLAQK